VVALSIETTQLKHYSYSRLFDYYGKAVAAARSGEDVLLDFEQCHFLHQNAVAFLGGMIRTVQRTGRKVYVRDG
jgi:hypothetical protein